MAAIGDLILRLLADDKGFAVDVEKKAAAAGDKAGLTMGQRLGKGVGTAMKAGLGVIAAGAAIATKGLIELENITADFRAETGATAEEADRATDAILDMSRRNIQPLGEIGKALTRVHTDLGLSGDAATETTERFLKFARATKQDASEAVLAFDDILDAWGLTAEDSGDLMDKLVVSHQEYGGSIEENQRQLANLAPQLSALNLDVDDGIALLNLFAASGLDASKAQFALNSAIQKMPPGETFDGVIRRLSAIEDPAERARQAIELFGARGGAALANVLRPGMEGLADFAVSTEEAAGATAEAAEVLDSTWGSRFQLLIKNAGGAILAFAKDFGPLVTALASVASLSGALGLDKLLIKGFEALKGSAQVKAAAMAAGALFGSTFGISFSAAAEAAIVAGLIVAIPAAIVLAATNSRGPITEAWKAILPDDWDRIIDEANAKIPASSLLPDPKRLEGTKPFWELLFAPAGDAAEQADGRVTSAVRHMASAAKDDLARVGPPSAAAGAAIGEIGTEAKDAARTVGTSAQKIIDAVLGIRNRLVEGASAAAEAIWGPTIAQADLAAARVELSEARQEAAKTKAGTRERAIAEGRVADARIALAKAQALVASYGDDTAKIGELKAQKLRILQSKEYLAGSREQKAILDQQIRRIDADLGRLAQTGGAGAKRAGRAIAQGVTVPMRDGVTDARIYGKRTGIAYGDGLRSAAIYVQQSARKVAAAAGLILRASSPPGPESPLHEIDVWGERTGEAWIDPLIQSIRHAIPRLRSAVGLAGGTFGMSPLTPAFAPSMGMSELSAPSISSVGSRAGAAEVASQTTIGGNTYHVHLTDRLEVRKPRHIVEELGRLESLGVLPVTRTTR